MSENKVVARKSIPKGQLLIDGEWRDARDGATMPTIDPTTEEVTTTVAKAAPVDADEAVQAAARAFESGPWSKMHGEERAKIMLKVADLIEARGEDIAYRETVDMGMPYGDFLKILVPHAAAVFRFCAALSLTSMDGALRQSFEHDIKILTRREPLGVVAAISPFNFPFLLSVSKVAPAFAAGNTVVHKPASDTPLSALALAQIMLDAGVPKGVYNLVTGPGGTIGDALVKNPRVDKVAFTGSTKVGQEIIRRGADTLKHTTMELGGKAPNIVFADADIDKAVNTAFWGIFWNKGEVCVAGSRLLVERPVYDEVVEKISRMARDAVVGDPLDPATVVGPLVNQSEYQKVLGYVEEGKKTAKLVAGGGTRKVNGKGFFVEPTVFANATNEIAISREEIFGPVLPIIPFDGEEEAIRLANDTPYGLASGIQTGDIARALRLAERIKAGTVWLNTWHKYHPNAPFGGYKMSGYGRENCAEALESYTQYKAIWAALG
jgi:aldehyde dehydrogenase (NAD+)